MKLVIVAALLFAACAAPRLRGALLPRRALAATPEAFRAPPDVAVLHYYGAGGWGVLWRGEYLLLAPYFSNHGMMRLALGGLQPDLAAIRRGFAGTPVAATKTILVGHGH